MAHLREGALRSHYYYYYFPQSLRSRADIQSWILQPMRKISLFIDHCSHAIH